MRVIGWPLRKRKSKLRRKACIALQQRKNRWYQRFFYALRRLVM